MKWKANARKRSNTVAANRAALEESTVALASKPIRMSHGKPVVMWSHTRDFVEADDDGIKTVVASIDFRQGDYLFPKAYLHPQKRIVGETKDARFTERGWLVYLDAVLRDKTGEPVTIDGCEIDMSGWYLESNLRDANLGMETIRLGATAPSIAGLHGLHASLPVVDMDGMRMAHRRRRRVELGLA